MTLLDALQHLRQDRRYAERIAAWRCLPERSGRYAAVPPGLEEEIVQLLHQRSMDRLYTHQAQAIEAALRGDNVAVVTGAASGKTLCYNVPVLNSLLRDADACALYLFPTKALSQDQLAAWAGLSTGLFPSALAATYDGDTPAAQRARLRQTARLLITNPDMLHMGILPHHTRWQRFFAKLKYVVIDEMHMYRGIFGGHVANLLRRLRRVCEFYGSHPTFICCSATIANPQELAQQLLGRPVKLVDQDGSPRGDKHVILYNPPLVDRSKGIRRSLVLEAATVADFFLSRDLPTIVFSRGRLSTELLLTYLRQSQRKMGLPSGRIRGYRGGYLPRERRAIERGLHEGRVRGVVSTNALELGVDIGDLSVCVLAGYPGTISSTWQQAGRAGRRQDVSAVVLVGGPLALDQYLLSHPDFLFGQTVERALLAPDNVHLLRSHLKCAAFELPVADDEVLAHSADWQSRLRSAAERDWHDLLQQLAEDEQVIRHSEGRWYWMSSQYPAQKMSLRTAAGDRFAICVEDGRVIGEMDSASVPLLLYPGAVYWHEGQAYLVTELSWEERLTRVRPAEVDYFTQASLSVQVEVLRQSQAGTPSRASGVGSQAGVSWAHGDVRLLTRPIGYKQISLYTHEQLASFPLDLPERELLTTAYWLYLEPNLVTALRDLGDWTIAPLLSYGPNWEVQRRRARERDGYRCCNCGRPESPGREHDVHHLQPFRTFDYRPGHNTAYIAANALSNLITLCPTCHPKVESLHIVQGTLDGLAHLLGALAPLYLMCDPQDLGVTWDLDLRHTRAPSIVLYDAVPGGVGFSAALYALHEELLQAALEWVSHCACEEGCPACIGAPAEIGAGAKRRVQQLLQQAVGGG